MADKWTDKPVLTDVADSDLLLAADMSEAVGTRDRGATLAALRRAILNELVVETAASGSAHDIDCALGTIHRVTLTAACTLTIANAPSRGFSVTLELIQDATGSRGVTWPAAVTWGGGTAPTLSTGAGAVDVVTLYTPDGGTTWRGFLAGQAFA